ncbi:hypothetical protein TSUD_27710 [Trifolium subterraneum]|uniref:Uncharacterized protein n=1 Tax=Trifolium subterraneum TaxID=3900 RepID=A0A2Z6P870_TRISU|nr:hypothetical protein TSUD_27710 [Trifolium subterraneum]
MAGVTASGSHHGDPGAATSRSSPPPSLVEFLPSVGIEPRTLGFKYVFNPFPLPIALLANHEFVGENHPNPPNHHNQFDGQEASVTPEGSAAHAQVTPLDAPPPQPLQPEDPLVVPQVPQGAPMEVVMAALVNTINRQGEILREQANNMRGQNELIREQNRRLRAVEESRAASRVSRSARRQRSPTPVNNRSRSRSRSPRPAPRRNAERPISPPRDIPRKQNHSPPRRNNHVSPPRNRRSPPRRNNRSPPRSGEAAARATYQRMMNKVFHNEIGDMLEVYMDDMIVKSEEEIDHTVHLKSVFDQARKFNMRFNPEKCTFGQLLARPDMVGRMLKWSLELAEFDISFESRKALKAQVLADFVAEMTTSTTSEKNKWTIFVDGSSNSQGSGAGIILENGDGVLIEVSLGLSFPTTNNQAEYEAFLAGLRLAEDMGAEEIRIFTDSQLVASQVSGEYQTKEERLLEYLNLIRAKLAKFKETEVKHVPREHNARADVLSKLASTRRKKAGNQSLIQETLTKPSIEKTAEVMHICAVDEQSWMSPVYNFLKSNALPVDAKEATKIRKRACSYVLLDDKLYRRGFSIPLLKCVEEARVEFILQEIHEGINGQHIGGRSLARKALRAGYYWPTMQNDARDHVLKCDKCKRHGDMKLAPANELKTMISPWPFAWWEMDILGPFPTTARQVKYLIVAVDYFTKWIEAEPLAKISASNILRFFKRDVLARFGIPQVVVTDNGTQFTNKKFQEFLAAIGTTQHFTSVEHPQTNGQAETANRVLLRGLRRRMGASKGNWTEELHHVLWSYRTTPHSTTGETPFRLTYGTEAVIPVEIGEPSSRIEYPLEEDINDELLREELDLVEELRTGASLREATLKQKIAARHDKRVIKRDFEVGSLVLRRNQKDSQEGKLAANWEGPYRVRAKTENGAYHLEDLYGKEIPRTWNAEKLKQYYS